MERPLLKKILPVLVPEFSYDQLLIQEGMDASEKWFSTVISENIAQIEKIEITKNLKQYCCLDSFRNV